jgi:hypothetical protein
MGYANDSLGATPSIRTFAQIFAAKKPAVTATAPAPVKIQIAPAPVTNPVTAFIERRFPIAPVPTPAPAPVMVQPETPAQAAAPLVAAAAAPAVGPIAAVIPPIADAAAKPSPTRIRIAPTPTPVATDLTPVTSGGGPELYAKDGTPLNEAAVSASTPNLLDQLQKLPPLALAGIAVGALFLLRKR